MLQRLFATALTSACLIMGAAAHAKDLTLLSSWDNNYNAVPVFVGQFAEKLKEKSNGDLNVQVRGPERFLPLNNCNRLQAGSSTCFSPMVPTI